MEEAKNATFGDAYMDSVVKEIQAAFPGIKGFNRRGLYRMKQFYEIYCDDEFVSALLTQISYFGVFVCNKQKRDSGQDCFRPQSKLNDNLTSNEKAIDTLNALRYYGR